jgi:excinuclease ABC subunit B
MPVTGVFIEKIYPSMKNWKMRMSTTASLLSGRRDILVVASVSYGIGNPYRISEKLIPIEKGQLSYQIIASIGAKFIF